MSDNVRHYCFDERRISSPAKLAILIDLDRLRQLMAQFVAEKSPHDPTAYTVPFETFLQWLQQRRKKERGNGE